MSIAVLILGPSGSGKSTSMRNLDPASLQLIQPIKKPLPFRNSWQPRNRDNPSGCVFQTDDPVEVEKAMRRAGRDLVIVDDYQAVLTNELMRRSTETGYQKFSDIGRSAWNVFMAAGDLADHQRVYIMAHTQVDELGNVRMKTVGKMVDEKVVPEGYFTIVLRAELVNGQHVFATQTNGQDCAKSPVGMFSDFHIPNDLAAVDAAIVDYYQLAQPT